MGSTGFINWGMIVLIFSTAMFFAYDSYGEESVIDKNGTAVFSIHEEQAKELGEDLNVVTEDMLEIRTREARGKLFPGQNEQDIIDDLQKIFAKLKQKNPKFDAEVSITRQVGALETDSGCDFVKDFCSAVDTNKTSAVGFTTDGPYFASLGVPVVIFGPGKPHLAHKPDEYIDISDLKKGVEYYKNIIFKFLS